MAFKLTVQPIEKITDTLIIDINSVVTM